MVFDPPLVPARLIRRYKRFLFDAVLDSGAMITGFCPNTGSMLGLTAPDSRILLSVHSSATRKYRFAFEIVELDGVHIGINTALPNRLAEEAIHQRLISDLADYRTLTREQSYGRGSRIDLLLSDEHRKTTYVEVKNVHFSRLPGLAEFPDTVTQRGTKHLHVLASMADAGHRAIMVYMIQRPDCHALRICGDLDPAYGRAFDLAKQRGVEAYAVNCRVSPQEITPFRLIPILEPGIDG